MLKKLLIGLIAVVGISCGKEIKHYDYEKYPNFTLNGVQQTEEGFIEQEYSLWDYDGKVVVLIFSTEWCGACRYAAEDVQDFIDIIAGTYDRDTFEFLYILTEKRDGSPADIPFLKRYAEEYGMYNPVLADPKWKAYSDYSTGFVPTIVVLDKRLNQGAIQPGYDRIWILGHIQQFMRRY